MTINNIKQCLQHLTQWDRHSLLITFPCLYQSLCGDYLVTDDPLPPVASARCDTDDPLLDGHQGDPDEGPPRTLTREGKLL